MSHAPEGSSRLLPSGRADRIETIQPIHYMLNDGLLSDAVITELFPKRTLVELLGIAEYD